jgi:hypothetical protein
MTTASRELAPALQGALRSRLASPSYTITGDTTLVPVANLWGFWWGGHYDGRKDGMHFEVAFIKT